MRGGLAFALTLLPVLGAADGWEVPEAEKARKNPVAAAKPALEKGQALYQKHCASCHGDKGKGDGPAAGHRAGTPIDLTLTDLKDLSDGEMLWKISTGLRDGADVLMPALSKEVKAEEDRWKVVLFVRTLARTP